LIGQRLEPRLERQASLVNETRVLDAAGLWSVKTHDHAIERDRLCAGGSAEQSTGERAGADQPENGSHRGRA
jgi:hypothetical protein